MSRLVEYCKSWTKPQPHPQTGDLLQPGERVTWLVMGIYRRWSVFIALQVLTFLWWSFPQYFPGGLFGWNLAWSDLAIIVEMMVGIAFLSQSMRDARIIRQELRQMQEDARLIREIHAALHPDGEGKLVLRDGTLEFKDPNALPLSRDLLVAG